MLLKKGNKRKWKLKINSRDRRKRLRTMMNMGFQILKMSMMKIDGNDDEEDEITTTFGATFQTDYEEEIQEIKRQQGLSPRGRKETRHNTTRARSRPLTRARSRGL